MPRFCVRCAFPDASRLLNHAVVERLSPRFAAANRVAPLNFLDWSEQQQAFTSVAAIAGGGRTLTGNDGEAERIPGQAVTWQFFDVLGVRPILGATFTAHDAAERRALVVISERLWRTRFGADPALVGRAMTLDGLPYTIVGVVPAKFQILFPANMWIALRAAPQPRAAATALHAGDWTHEAGRHDRAGARGHGRRGDAHRGDRARHEQADWGVTIEPLRDAIVGQELRTTSLVLVRRRRLRAAHGVRERGEPAARAGPRAHA